MASEGARAVTSRVFSAYGPPIDIVTSFEYLGRVILAVQDDWLAVIQKTGKGMDGLAENVKYPKRGGGEAIGVQIFL